MHECETTGQFEHEQLIYSTKNCSTYLATGGDETVLLKKTKGPIKGFIPTIIMNKEINRLESVLESTKAFREGSTPIFVQQYEGVMPLVMVLKEVEEEGIPFFVKRLLKIAEEEKLLKILEVVGLTNIWVNEQGDLKICWASTVLENERLFDNEVYKMNVSLLENINKLIELNTRHCKKRLYNFPNSSDDNISYMSKTNTPKIFVPERSTLSNIATPFNKTGKRKHGNKKVCVVETEEKDKPETKPVALRLVAIRKLVGRLLFFKSEVTEKDLETKVERLSERLKNNLVRPEDIHVSPTTLQLLKGIFLEEGTGSLEEDTGSLEEETGLQERIREIVSRFKGQCLRSPRDVFTMNGFDMEGFSTKSYKKGRFQVYEAVPASLEGREERMADLLRIVDIQNQQIEMIYRTIKERNSINKVEDDQLESLSKEINNLFQKFNQDE